MDIFRKAKAIRMISHNDRYLAADEDHLTVIHSSHNGAPTIWTVEVEDNEDFIRLKSCHGTYLTASSNPFLPGVTGKKVIQTQPSYLDPTTKWQPIRDGMQVRLKSFWGNYLRPNGGLPPWRGSVTHDVPHRPKTRDKILWDVEVVEKKAEKTKPSQKLAAQPMSEEKMRRLRSRSLNFHRDGLFGACFVDIIAFWEGPNGKRKKAIQ